jgi:hypothetical protein
VPPDLVVDSVTVGSPVAAPCPTIVIVMIRNAGQHPASYPFDVCLDVAGSATGTVLARVVKALAGPGILGPGQQLTLGFSLELPCLPQAWIRATADCSFKVVSNLRSNPTKAIQVGAISSAPWLTTELHIGIAETGGIVSWNPPSLCAGQTIAFQVTVTNRGCADAPATITDLVITDQAGQIVDNPGWPTPPLQAGASATFTHQLMSLSPSITSLTASVCADVGSSVQGQCDRAQLCRTITLPVSTTSGAPQLTISVGTPVHPKETLDLAWSVQNDCSDLGTITARLLFAGAEIHSRTQPIKPKGSGGEQLSGFEVPLTVPGSVWSIGTKQLELRVEGSGAVKGPFSAFAPIQVIPESVGSTWWAWPPAGGESWHQTYLVGGTLVNRGSARMTPTAITIREHPTAASDASEDIVRAVLTPLAPIAPGRSATHNTPGIFKDWVWTGGPAWTQTGPREVDFDYTATFTLVDEFGNAYAAATSSVFGIGVFVPEPKWTLQLAALAEFVLAVVLLAMAVVLGIAAVFNPALLPLAFATATAGSLLLGLSTWHGAQALDPPSPDFRYEERVIVTPAASLELPPEAPPWLESLRMVCELLERGRAGHEAMTRIHAKILGAHVDGAVEPLALLARDYRAAVDVVRRSADLLPDATTATARLMDEDEAFRPGSLPEALDAWRHDPKRAKDLWRQAQLRDDDLALIEGGERELETVPDSVQAALMELGSIAVGLADAVALEAETVLALTGPER